MPQNTWVEVRHPTTNKLAGRYCPQTHQFEVVDRRERGVIALPPLQPAEVVSPAAGR